MTPREIIEYSFAISLGLLMLGGSTCVVVAMFRKLLEER